MSASDLTAIPLPVEPSSTGATKKTAREMLQEALRGHKSSSSKESNASSKHTSSKLGAVLSSKSAGANESGESSQSIVDELFKDFIARKFSGTSRDKTVTGDETEMCRVRNSADEISKILDMEIKSIKSQTEIRIVTKQQDKFIGRKDKSKSSKQPKFNPIISLANGRKEQSEDVLTFHCDENIAQPEMHSKTTSVSSIISESDNLSGSAKSQSLITSSPDIANATGTVGIVTENASFSTIQLKDTLPPQTGDSINVTIKRTLMLPTQIAKKMVPPKVLGVKLSTESLSLITSTDRIDREGRLWEEGEVPSSQGEDSGKEIGESGSEHDGLPSDSGSVNSSAEGWKTHGSKHKKKHKHRHRKKRKKSAREKDDSGEKDKHRESKDKDKNRGRGKDVDENYKDRHKSLVKDETGNENTRNSKDRDDVKEVDKSAEKYTKDKDKSSDIELEGSRRRDREADKKRKRSKSRSKSPKRHKRSKSRSGSRSKSPKRHGSWSSAGGSSVYSEWDARRYCDDPSKFSSRDRSRSRSNERSSDRRRQSRDDSRSLQRSRNQEEIDRDLRLQIDKAKLRKIAIANALQNMRAGQGPQIDLTVVKSGGKSVEELTAFCKRISEKSKTGAGSDRSNNSDDDVAKNSDDEDTLIHHPFKVKEANSGGIVMNIRNAKQLPVLTPSEKQAQQATLRLTFPVSSGSIHRASESEWVPVVKTPAGPTTTATVPPSAQVTSEAVVPIEQKKVVSIFPHPSETQQIDIGSIISERLQAVRKLQENPFDMQALSKMHQVQEQASKWATSKHLPGQFTGSTGAQVLSQEQLIGDRKHQAWAKKTQLSQAVPVNGGIGMFLLQKMGWKQGEGLGKNNEGSREPLMLDIKIDRRGLTTATENPRHKAQIVNMPRAKDLSNKHPVSALMELCNRRRWGLPLFTVVSESGPDHKKSFLYKVMVNNVEYQPAGPSSNKKMAKAQCAAICLQEMGLLPRDAPLNI